MDITTGRDEKRSSHGSSSRKSSVFRSIASPRHRLLSLGIAGLLTLVFVLTPFMSQRQAAYALSNGVALTPPMGGRAGMHISRISMRR